VCTFDLEDESCEERTDIHECRGEEHAIFSTEFVGGESEYEDTDYGANKESVGDACLDGCYVDFGGEEVIDDDVGGRCLGC